jgi:hypothetical protein
VDKVLYVEFPKGMSREAMSRVTLRQINSMVRESVRDPLVKRTAHSILQAAGVSPRDQVGVVRAIHHWVQKHFKYEYDPGSTEMVTHPRNAIAAILKHGRYEEDCDGFVATEMALLGVILGLRNVRSTIVKADKRDPSQWSHIYLQARVRGHWITLDPIMQGEDKKRPLKPIGWEAPKVYERERVPITGPASLELTAQRDGLKSYERGHGMGKWIPAQRGRFARGNSMAYEDDTWFDRLPDLPDNPAADPRNEYGLGPSGVLPPAVSGLGSAMSHQYAQRELVKGGAREADMGIGAILSNDYAQQAGVPGYRPTTTGEDPQVAAGTPYWEAPGTVGGTMRAQAGKTAAVSGVADYIQLGQAAKPSPWASVAANIMQTTTGIMQQEQLAQLNRERIKQGLPPITPAQSTAAATGAGAKTSTMVGLVAVAVLGGALFWSMRRRKRR